MKKPLILFFIFILGLVLFLLRPWASYPVDYVGAWDHFKGPIGIALDSNKNIWVVDSVLNKVFKLNSDGKILFSFGKKGKKRGELNRPMDIAFDKDDHLYIPEYGNDRISVFDSYGRFLYAFGTKGQKNGQFDAPSGISIDKEFIFVSDFYNHRVQKFNHQGRYLATIGKSGRWRSGTLHYPTDLDFDPKGNLIVADAYNNRVQIFNKNGNYIRKWGGILGLGLPLPLPGWFRVATGVYSDRGKRVYVADFYNNRIQVFTEKGKYKGAFGTKKLKHPADLIVDARGLIYICDFGNRKIKIFKHK